MPVQKVSKEEFEENFEKEVIKFLIIIKSIIFLIILFHTTDRDGPGLVIND